MANPHQHAMTVAQLIAALEHYPSDRPVTFDGYDVTDVDEYGENGDEVVVLS